MVESSPSRYGYSTGRKVLKRYLMAMDATCAILHGQHFLTTHYSRTVSASVLGSRVGIHTLLNRNALSATGTGATDAANVCS